MRNILLDRINNSRFTVRLCTISAKYNIKTVGKLYKFCKKNPTIPFGGFFGQWPFKTERLLKELENYIKQQS